MCVNTWRREYTSSWRRVARLTSLGADGGQQEGNDRLYKCYKPSVFPGDRAVMQQYHT